MSEKLTLKNEKGKESLEEIEIGVLVEAFYENPEEFLKFFEIKL